MLVNGTQVSFPNVLSRAGDVDLEEFVGLDVVRWLRSIDPAVATPTSLSNFLPDFDLP